LCRYVAARAGLHLPTDAPTTAGDTGADTPAAGAAVPWTKHVLTDLGDAQSLDLEGGAIGI
jgi:hypothetical protein